jgi:hypothetical protein
MASIWRVWEKGLTILVEVLLLIYASEERSKVSEGWGVGL